MHAQWLQEFIDHELSPLQQSRSRSRQTSMFEAYLKNNFGGRAPVMSLWQTGVTWAPTIHMQKTDYNGALEHIAKQFGKWAQRIIRARKLHQEDPATKDAQRRSGRNTGLHGLTEEGVELRQSSKQARSDFYWAQDLRNQILASKGNGKRIGKATAQGKSLPPKRYDEMTNDEQWWLEQFWSGILRAELHQAEKLTTRVQAKDFNVSEYDYEVD